MNIKALVTTLILGSTSIAAADPFVRDHRTHLPPPVATPTPAPIAQPHYGYGFGFGGYVRPQRPLTWVTLATSAHVNGREMIRVAPTQRTFTKLELRSTGGKTKLDKIMILFANGRSQVVDYNKMMLAGNQTLSIDLNGNARSIKGIVLVGKSNRRASLDVRAI